MTDEMLELTLRDTGSTTPVPVPPSLKARTLAQLRSRRLPGRLPALAVATLAMLILIPASLLAMGEPVLGVQITISDMSPAEWLKHSFQDWIASPGPPEFLSPEETARVASFPIRQPAWLPEGMQASGEPIGAYANSFQDGQWETGDTFFVTQSFRGGDSWVAVLHQVRGEIRNLTLPPGTEMLTVAGHPAFLRLEVPMAKADAENEARSREGRLPEIVSYRNKLTLWVQEEGGSVTAIDLLGNLDPDSLIRIAESMF